MRWARLDGDFLCEMGEVRRGEMAGDERDSISHLFRSLDLGDGEATILFSSLDLGRVDIFAIFAPCRKTFKCLTLHFDTRE